MGFEVTLDLSGFNTKLAELYGQLPFAAARALTKTADDVIQAEYRHMGQVLDRPVPYTLNSLYREPATKVKPEAVVRFKDRGGQGVPAVKYLAPEIKGGDRHLKRLERALLAMGLMHSGQFVMPARGLKLDQYGNIPRSKAQEILAGLRAYTSGSSLGQMIGKRKKLQALVQASPYFAVVKDAQHLPPGVYRRLPRSPGETSGNVEMVLAFARKPTYSVRLDFEGVARRTALEKWPSNLREASIDALRSMR